MVAGLTMAVVPKSLGLVAALAVSGTTLYFVYGYNKKKAFVNIHRGEEGSCIHRGSKLRRESALYLQGGSDIPVGTESEVCVGLSEEEDNGIEEVQWHELRWRRKAIRFLPPTAPEAEQMSKGSGDRTQDTEHPSKDRLASCVVDAAQVNGLCDTGNHPHQHVANFSIVVTSTGKLSQSKFQGRQENSDANSACLSSPTSNNCSIQEGPAADSCSEDDFSSKASLSSVATAPSSQKLHTLVGCRVRQGSGKAAGKPKKVVRFSPSVAEPSSNNQAYRSRFNKAETTQRAAVEQRTHVPSSTVAVRSITFDRPRQTLTYSVHRYRGKSFY
ncbi:unnamed protein product [Calypogeia fissa]